MKKFNKCWTVGEQVQVLGKKGKFKIKEIHVTKNWITLDGLLGFFQRCHVKKS